MDNLYYKVKLYLEANSKTESEFDSNISLRNDSDGNGDYIKVWNVSGLAKPSDTQLNSYASNATKENNNSIIRQTRKASYGLIGDQLDLLYKDMLADKGDKTGEWFKKIKAVKDDNAKE
jgi:hypothetical protein